LPRLGKFAERADVEGTFRLGVASGLRPVPGWKQEADFLLTQVSFSAKALLEWRASIRFSGPVFAGVMVIPSASMAAKLSADVPQLAVPGPIIDQLDRDPDAGVEIACDLIWEIRESNAFDGIHLIPVSRYREMAARLEPLL
jgi:5,10-methylenetetrahydrofolate reductase